MTTRSKIIARVRDFTGDPGADESVAFICDMDGRCRMWLALKGDRRLAGNAVSLMGARIMAARAVKRLRKEGRRGE